MLLLFFLHFLLRFASYYFHINRLYPTFFYANLNFTLFIVPICFCLISFKGVERRMSGVGKRDDGGDRHYTHVTWRTKQKKTIRIGDDFRGVFAPLLHVPTYLRCT